jgi:hypothetical protein
VTAREFLRFDANAALSSRPFSFSPSPRRSIAIGHWVSVRVDTDDPNLFIFEPRIVPANAN